MLIEIKGVPLQRLQNIASMKGITLQEALKASIGISYFLSDKKLQGYAVLLSKDKVIEELVNL